MNIYKKSLLNINKFFQINLRNKNCVDEIFNVLQEILPYESAYIFYIFPDGVKAEYTRNNKLSNNCYAQIDDIDFKTKNLLKSDFKIDNAVFATLILCGNNQYTQDEELIFSTVSEIISNLIKNIELNNIISLQVKAQQETIIELNKAYKTIEKQNKKILKSDKIKSDFLANITHELRTPLNSIIGFSDLLTAKCIGDLNDKQEEYLNDIKISGLHLLGMINEILDMSKIEAGAVRLNKTLFNAKTAAEEVLNIIRPLAIKKNIRLIPDIEEIEVSADYQKFQQILFNLLNNAIKFTPENGTVQLKTEMSGCKYTLTVKDTGCGIEKKYHKKIFNKFEQGKNKDTQNSTGLGLTITKALVKLHGGTISLKSEPECGTEFIVTLPC